jgi:KDO2-lipid IV(A) lauroyltransferase
MASFRLLRGAAALAPRLGPRVAPALFGMIGRLGWRLAPARSVIEQNQRHLPREDRRVRESSESFGRYLGEFLSIEGRADRLRFLTGEARIDSIRNAVAAGKTVLAVTPHFGNWEFGGLWLGALFGPVRIIIRRTGDPVLDERILRCRGANELIDAETSVMRVHRVLAKPGIVCAAIDEPRASGVEVILLGHRVRWSKALFVMAARAGAVIIPTVCHRRSDGRLDLVSEAPAATPQEVADRFDRWIREDPGQWVLLRRC